jgi:transketolase
METHGITGETTYDDITRRMRSAGWINKATDTHSEHVAHRFSTAMVVQTHPNIMFIRTVPVPFTVLPGQQRFGTV